MQIVQQCKAKCQNIHSALAIFSILKMVCMQSLAKDVLFLFIQNAKTLLE
jgi:hypothetical protein